MALPAIALVGNLLLWFDLIPLGMESRRIVFPIWAIATLAIWVATVVLAASLIKGRSWLVCPLGILAVTGTAATGITGAFQASVAWFVNLLALTLAASVLALRTFKPGIASPFDRRPPFRRNGSCGSARKIGSAFSTKSTTRIGKYGSSPSE
jgi:hypothetical protein